MPSPQLRTAVTPKSDGDQSPIFHRYATRPSTATTASKPKRWDALRRTCVVWDILRKDNELWTRNGNCLVYVHSTKSAKSRHAAESPAFKLPFSLLLAMKCYPLIERFLVTKSSDGEPRCPRTPSEILKWYRSDPERVVELHISAPPAADQKQIWRHQLSTRNFFAWILKRPLVGESLGEAMIELLHSMHEYRSGGKVDNSADMMHYLEEKGYLCLAGQPDYALAVLRLAETFRMKDLYLEALVHCVGMREMLPKRSEFQNLSSSTRKLIHDGDKDLKNRLKRTAAMLENFLDHELSETHLGIPTNIRAHLERFRSFLLSFYSTKLGYYPPRSLDGSVYRAMATDFEALYNLLVDEAYSSSDALPSVAVGGICTLQLVQSFDTHSEFEPMTHPLPKLPRNHQPQRSKRVSWFPRGPKHRADERQLGHVALVKASNWKEDAFQNSLVRAYRKFEEDCAMDTKRIDRNERVSLLDGRKIRWLLIYAVHQTLRYTTQRPAGVRDDPAAKYLLSVTENTLPPWEDRTPPGGLLRCQTEPALSYQAEFHGEDVSASGFEIKPDIDYFALTHKDGNSVPSRPRGGSLSISTENSTTLSRASSFKQALSRSSTVRRSMRRLRRGTTSSAPPTPVTPTKSFHHEIVVQGYGDGTNVVHMDSDPVPPLPPPNVGRSASTASETGSSNISTSTSSASMADTLESSLSSPVSLDSPIEMAFRSKRWSHQDVTVSNSGSPTMPSSSVLSKSNSFKRRPISSALEGYNYATKAFGQFVENERRSIFASSRQSTSDVKRSVSVSQSRSMPLPTREADIVEEPYILSRDSGDWTAMQAFLDGKRPDGLETHAWEQYADLGGLTEVR